MKTLAAAIAATMLVTTAHAEVKTKIGTVKYSEPMYKLVEVWEDVEVCEVVHENVEADEEVGIVGVVDEATDTELLAEEDTVECSIVQKAKAESELDYYIVRVNVGNRTLSYKSDIQYRRGDKLKVAVK